MLGPRKIIYLNQVTKDFSFTEDIIFFSKESFFSFFFISEGLVQTEGKFTSYNPDLVTLITDNLLIFYQHSPSSLECQRSPVQHVPRSEIKILHVALDLAGRQGVVQHEDLSYPAYKRLIDVKCIAITILFLKENAEN